MTRRAQAKQAVTAKGKPRVAASAVSRSAPAKFLTFEVSGGAYHWMVVARSGETLVRFASLATYGERKQAARGVHVGAASASLEHLGGDGPPVDLAARRHVEVMRDDLDAERWVDEGGSFRSAAVTRWPAPR